MERMSSRGCAFTMFSITVRRASAYSSQLYKIRTLIIPTEIPPAADSGAKLGFSPHSEAESPDSEPGSTSRC